MKKVLLVTLALAVMVGALCAEAMTPGPQKGMLDSPIGRAIPRTRNVPEYNFSVLPTSLMTSYWDYMIGGYNGLPIRTIPSEYGGGYFMTYMGQRQPTSQRRVFYAYVNGAGQIVSNNEITNVVNREGFPTLAVDRVSGKPIYAWHANHDSDAELEVEYTSDAFLDGIAGLFNDIGVIVDNPYTIEAPNGTITTDNEFIWPTAVIGPSPVPGKRRVYVDTPNAVNHNGSPVGNVLISYADFDGDDIEMGNPLVWNHTSIPELNTWDTTTETWRRTFNSITVDQAGNVYYVGYHFAQDEEDNSIDEPDFDVHICDNYGEGVWRRVSAYSDLSSWNPLDYFEIETGVPFADEDLSWSISNSGHLNAVVTNDNKIIAIAHWALKNNNGTYWPAFQVMKAMVFDIANETFEIREIYPISENPNDYFQPWDIEAPWGEVDEVDDDGNPLFFTMYPFPYWDDTAADAAMMFHYNHMKITEPNDMDMMVAVWQDSQRARWFNAFQIADYSDFANTPEVYIAVSPDNGNTWSEPIILNNVETPEFGNLKPMWPYPADRVIFERWEGAHKVGKIALMFFDDETWGSYSNAPPVHPTNDGGRVMFTELEIVFPLSGNNSENTIPALTQMLKQNYPNPFNPETTISFDLPNAGPASLSVYNIKGQLVKTLVNGQLNNGQHKVVWNGTDNSGNSVTSGIYFYRLSHNGSSETRKMMLMK